MLICIELFSTIKGGLKALYENNYDKIVDHLKIKIGLNYFDRHREKIEISTAIKRWLASIPVELT